LLSFPVFLKHFNELPLKEQRFTYFEFHSELDFNDSFCLFFEKYFFPNYQECKLTNEECKNILKYYDEVDNLLIKCFFDFLLSTNPKFANISSLKKNVNNYLDFWFNNFEKNDLSPASLTRMLSFVSNDKKEIKLYEHLCKAEPMTIIKVVPRIIKDPNISHFLTIKQCSILLNKFSKTDLKLEEKYIPLYTQTYETFLFFLKKDDEVYKKYKKDIYNFIKRNINFYFVFPYPFSIVKEYLEEHEQIKENEYKKMQSFSNKERLSYLLNEVKEKINLNNKELNPNIIMCDCSSTLNSFFYYFQPDNNFSSFLSEILKDNPSIPKDREEYFVDRFTNFFSKKFENSIYDIILEFENCLRYYFECKGKTILKNNSEDVINLTAFFPNNNATEFSNELKNILGVETYESLNSLFSKENKTLNIRNRIAHRINSSTLYKDFSSSCAVILILISIIEIKKYERIIEIKNEI